MVRTLLAILALSALSAAAHAAPIGLEQYINAYYLAEGKLRDFDAELTAHAAPGFLRRSGTYKELLALHIILDGKAHALEKALARLTRGETDSFLAELNALGPVERIAVTNLLPEVTRAPFPLPTFFANLEQELAVRRAARDAMAARTAQARLDPKLAEEVRALAATLDFGAREERVLRVRPGAGPEGTIDGSNFPAKTWALTYDDGPHPTYTPNVLANLAELKKKASFLWLTECLEENPHLPAAAAAQNMPTNNHSWTHENLDKAKPAVLQKEIVASTERETQIYGARPRFFRLPYGAGLHNQPVRQLIAENGMIHVFWNVDSLDWQDKDPASILARVKKEMAAEKKGIILFHDIHPQSVAASKLVLQWSATLDGSAASHRWVTLPEIVDELNH